MGAISSVTFGVRNAGMGTSDPIREPVSALQMYNAAANSVNSSIKFVANNAQKVMEKVDELGNKINVENASTKAAKFASSMVNPLLVAAAGYRVLNDEDKKSAFIEETCGMGSMFATERLYKTTRNTINKELSKDIKGATFTGQKTTDFAKNIADKISKLPDAKQKLLFILAELGFVGASIGTYTIGNKFGKTITGRDNNPFREKTTETTTSKNC